MHVVYVRTSGLVEGKKMRCLVRSWQQTIKVFTLAKSGVESRRLKEEKTRGIRGGDERNGIVDTE